MVVTLPDKTKANPSEVQSSDMNMDMDMSSFNGNLNIISIFYNIYVLFEEGMAYCFAAVCLSDCLFVGRSTNRVL